jgi:NDP-sugar pyrophosphorylase family protein
MNLTLLIMAAGIGSRYGSLKQMDRIRSSGETIMDYSIYDAIRAGFSKVVLIVRKDIEKELQELFSEKLKDKIDLDFALQELSDLPDNFPVPGERKKPWGTGHAIWTARDKITTPFAVINADDFYGYGSFENARDYLRSPEETSGNNYCNIGYKINNTLSQHGFVTRALCDMNKKGYLLKIIERKKIKRIGDNIVYMGTEGQQLLLDKSTIVSMNMWGFTPSIFDHLEFYLRQFTQEKAYDPNAEFLIPTVIDSLITSGKAKVKVIKSNEKWFGMTYLEDKAEVKKRLVSLIKNKIYPDPLWK